jgi:hypothetical protein
MNALYRESPQVLKRIHCRLSHEHQTFSFAGNANSKQAKAAVHYNL